MMENVSSFNSCIYRTQEPEMKQRLRWCLAQTQLLLCSKHSRLPLCAELDRKLLVGSGCTLQRTNGSLFTAHKLGWYHELGLQSPSASLFRCQHLDVTVNWSLVKPESLQPSSTDRTREMVEREHGKHCVFI